MKALNHKLPVRLGTLLLAVLLALPLSLFASCDSNNPKPGTTPSDTTLTDPSGGEDPTDPSAPTDPSVPTDPDTPTDPDVPTTPGDDPVDPGTDTPDDPDTPANPNHPGNSALYKGVMIHSVYGTGKKGAEALISNGYVQLYNASSKAVSLKGASLYYKSDGANPFDQFVFPEDAVIPAGGYYLVRANAPADFVESNAVLKVESFDAEWDVYLDNKEIRLLLAPSGWSIGRDEDVTTFKDAVSVFVATMAHHESVYALYDLSRNKIAVRTALKDYSGYHTVNLTRTATPELRKLCTRTSDGTVNEVVASKLNEVLFSADAGIYKKAFVLTLQAKDGYKIYYTTDGTDPSVSTNKSRKLYSSGIQLSDTSAMSWGPLTNLWQAPAASTQVGGHVIKAYATNGTDSTDVFTNTYFITDDLEKYGVTIMSISMPKEEVIGNKGFYNNYMLIPGNITSGRNRGTGIIEFFDPDGNRVGNSRVEMAVSGNGSSGLPMKSLRLYFKGINNQDAGLQSDLHYDIFGGLARDQHGQAITSFSRIMIRNSGNDYGSSFIRDAYMQRVCDDLNVDVMASVSTLVFINGEFWGVYNMRERYSPEYVESHYGVDKENVAVIESDYSQVHTNTNAPYVVSSGLEDDAKPFNDMVDYMRSHNLSDQVAYDYVASLMDIDSFIDMWVTRLYFNARDWPENNVKVWRNRNPEDPSGFDTKWHFTLLDMDMGLGFFPAHDGANTSENANFFAGFITHSPSVCASMMRSLLQNQGFRDQFIVRYYEVVKYHFTPEFLNAEFDLFYDERNPLTPLQQGRWGYSSSTWQHQVSAIRSFINNRQEYALHYFYSHFGISEADVQNLISQRVTVSFQETRADVTVDGKSVKSGHVIELEKNQTVTLKIKATVKNGFVITGIAYTDIAGQTQTVEGAEATFTVSKSGTISVYTKRANVSQDELKSSTLVAGATYLFYLTGNGDLYGWGDNRYGVLGLDPNQAIVNTPTFIMDNVAKVATASGNDYENNNALFATAILTKDGRLFTVGRNSSGQLGRNGTADDYKLAEVKTSFKVADVSVGHDHMLVLDASGTLWGIGSNRNGALGTAELGGNVLSFVKIDTNVETISAGRRTSVYIKSDGSMWGMGDNRWNKMLNTATHGENISTPKKLLDKATFVDSGEHQILAVDASGKLYYAGWRTLEGFNQGAGNDPSLALVMAGVKKADIYHSDIVILGNNGDVYVYGHNNGNSTGHAVASGAPQKLRSGVLDVAAGFAFTAYLLEDGTILVQGDNSFGQAGNGTSGGSVNMSEVNF